MKKAICLAMILLALLVCVSAAADAIDIVNSGEFPDPAFQKYLLAIIPAGNDGFLTDEVIDEITEISVHKMGIKNLKGIEYFKNLTELDCADNQLIELNVRELKNLTILTCDRNQLRELDVSGLTKLKSLYCQINHSMTSLNAGGCSSLRVIEAFNDDDDGKNPGLLSKLNITGCSALQELIVFGNQLTSLDVSGRSALKDLSASNNSISSLNVSGCSALESLAVSCNKLSSIDISSCGKLDTLNVAENQLSSIDISKCTATLEYLGVEYNKLSSLNINGCKSLVALFCHDNKIPSLDITTAPIIKNAYRNGDRATEGNIQKYSLDYDHPSGNTLWVDKSTVIIVNNTVSFNANGGKGTMQPLSVPNGEAVTLPANSFSRVGWRFTSWNTKKDGSGTSYSNKASLTLKDQDLTLYAQWVKMKKIPGLRLKALSKDKIIVSWTKLSKNQKKECKYVEIQISTNKNFKKILKTQRVKSSKTTFTFKKLKPNTKYYIRVRAYTKSGKVINVSKWTVKNIKTKKK